MMCILRSTNPLCNYALRRRFQRIERILNQTSHRAGGGMFGFREGAEGLLVLLFVAADAVGEHRDDLMQVANDA